MKNLIYLVVVLSFYTVSCNKIKNKSKEALNKSGEVVGKSATEFFEGVGDGVQETLGLKILLSDTLKEQGLSLGKATYSTDTNSVKNNLLTIYLISEKDFNSTLKFKVFDENKLEIGRSQINVDLKKGDADYFDVRFNKRTDIESKSIIEIK